MIMKSLLLFCLLTTSWSPTQAQDLNNIVSAIRGGNAQVLSQHFGGNVEVGVLGQQKTYSKAQAVSTVQRFFDQYKPTSFSQVHKGTSPDGKSKYCIGDLQAGGKSFRVYIYMDDTSGKTVIKELRFDKD